MEKKGSRTMRKTWKKLAAMAVTASMVICGGAMGVSAATEEESEKVTVNVAYMPDYGCTAYRVLRWTNNHSGYGIWIY